MREFIELSRRLNFTTTARALHMTQPSLSNHVRSLEQETGVLLIERSSKDLARLTPAGQRFAETAKQVVGMYDEMLPELRELARDTKGKIVLRSPRNELSEPLMDYVSQFRRLNPQIDFVLLPWVDLDGMGDVHHGEVDCAYAGFATEIPDWADQEPEVSLVAFACDEMHLWLDRAHPLATKERLRLEDLAGYELVIPANKRRDSWYSGVRGILQAHGLDCRIDERYCDSLEDLVLSKMHADDLLLCDGALLSSSCFRLREDRVARTFEPRLRQPISLAYRNDGDNPALAAFVDFLRGKYAG